MIFTSRDISVFQVSPFVSSNKTYRNDYFKNTMQNNFVLSFCLFYNSSLPGICFSAKQYLLSNDDIKFPRLSPQLESAKFFTR